MNVGVFDPFLLACPNGQPPIELESFARRLLALKSLKSTSFFRVVASPTMAEALAEINGHPVWSHVMAAMQPDGAIDPKDVIALFNALMEKLEQMDVVLGIREVMSSELTINPPFYKERPAVMRAEFEKICLVVGVYLARTPDPKFIVCILTRDLPVSYLELDVKAKIELVEMASGELMEGTPFNIDLKIASVDNADDTWALVDPVQGWRRSRSPNDLRRSIEIYLASTYQVPLGAIPPFSLGRDFASSIFDSKENQGAGSIPLLRACAETILGRNMRDTHVIRTSVKAASPQLFRGQDGAWRRDIDYERHLHYWATRGGPELAKVTSVHNDMEIPE